MQSVPKRSLLILFLSVCILFMAVYINNQHSQQAANSNEAVAQVIEPGKTLGADTEVQQDAFTVTLNENDEDVVVKANFNLDVNTKCADAPCVVSIELAKTEGKFVNSDGSEQNYDPAGNSFAFPRSALDGSIQLRAKIGVMGEMAKLSAQIFSEALSLP